MDKNFSIEIKGMRETINYLAEKNLAIQDASDKAVFQSALMVEAEVKASIAGQRSEKRSVDTGRFLSSVWTKHTQKYVASIEPMVDYGIYLEYGTSKMQGRYHFRNSLNRMRDKIPAEFNTEIKSEVRD